jgi:GNAT superfamily N-acetyltransferase
MFFGWHSQSSAGEFQHLDRGMLKLSGNEVALAPVAVLTDATILKNGYYLHDLAINKKFQRMGLAKLLFQAVLKHALEEGYPTLALVSVQKTWRFWQQKVRTILHRGSSPPKGFQVIKRLDYGGSKAYFMERLITN